MIFCKKVLIILALLLAGDLMVFGFTTNDADTIFNAFNAAFYVTNSSGNNYYKTDTGTGTGPGWWTFAEEIEMAEDTYDRTGYASTKNIITGLCNGFISENGKLWTSDIYNDDISWAVIAFSRAYQITGNTTFRDCAKTNFDAMYSRAWDTTFTGGGLWWNTEKQSKNACISGPATVAACYLYNIFSDSSYLGKAEACYAWERRVLFQTNSGAIDDSIATNYVYNTWASTYNQGTFIGSGNFLYRITGLPFYYQDAVLAAKYTQNNLSTAGILPVYSSGDLGGFNGIFIRWMGRMAKDENLLPFYAPWLNTNANAAWNYRNTNNLSWYNWTAATPAGTNVLDSWDCSDSVIALQLGITNAPDTLQVTPATGFVAASQYSVLPNATSSGLFLTNSSAAILNWSLSTTSIWLSIPINSGTLAAGGSVTNVAVNLIPSAVTNFPAGQYYATVWLTNLVSGVGQSLPFSLLISASNAPVAVTGFNASILAPNTATTAVPGATAFDFPNNYAFYQVGLNGSTRGLPPNGAFTSQADGATIFQFQPYGGTNALILGYNYPSSATLTLATPQAYNSISVLACSANASGGIGTFVLNFADGTHSQSFNFNAQDWFNTTANVAIQAMGRLKLGAGFGAEDDGAANPNLYQTTINLAALGLNQPITSITFTKPSNPGSQQDCAVFAVSGMVMPLMPAMIQQPVSVTNNVPTQGVTFVSLASGVPPLTYQWYYSSNGNAGNYSLLASANGTALSLNAVLQATNAGDYYVVVTNNYGSVTSSVAALMIYRAPIITQQPSPTNLFLFAGSSNTWSIAANAALPATYLFNQNGSMISSSANPFFSLANLQLTNSGNYAVVVSNAYGAITSSIVSLTVVALPNYPFGQTVLADHSIGYWRLDESSGTIAHDYIAGDNGIYTVKVLLNQPGDNLVSSHSTAQFGYLAASNSCVTNIAMDFSTASNTAFSVEAWVKGGPQTTDAGLITKGYGNGGEQFNLDCGGGNHAFRFFVRDMSGNAHVASSAVVPNNQWHHLVGVCDEVNGYVYLYVDGTNSAQTTIPTNAGILSSALMMSLGSRESGLGTAYDNQFVGYMEEAAVYNYALSSTQVQNHFIAATNVAPIFLANPFSTASVVAGQSYSATISTNAIDPNGDEVFFGKIAGPSWLTLSSSGVLGGTPLSSNVGTNTFMVSAMDPAGLSNTATMNLVVLSAPPIVTGVTFQGTSLTLNWTGGIAPYQIQMTTNLVNPVWQNIGVPVNANSLLVSPTNASAFYRINGQ